VITCDTSKVIREGANIPGQNYYVVLVNSKNYGGAALIGLNTFVTSRNAKPTSPLGALPVDVFLHELGHSLGKLADEYSSPGASCTGDQPNAVQVNEAGMIAQQRGWYR
jgi:hypothetical protein